MGFPLEGLSILSENSSPIIINDVVEHLSNLYYNHVTWQHLPLLGYIAPHFSVQLLILELRRIVKLNCNCMLVVKEML